MSALQTVQWAMGYRNRRVLVAIATYMVAVLGLFGSTELQRLPGILLACIVIVGIFAYLILFGILIHQDAEVGTKGSSFPVYLFSLPIKTGPLVFVPMATGTVVMLGTGLLIARAAHSGGSSTALYWPAFMIAAFLAMLQAIFWYPIGFSYSKMLLTLVGIPLVATYVGASLSEGVSEGKVCLGLALFTSLMYGIAYQGVSRARRGEGQLVRIERPETVSTPKTVRWLRPFSGPYAAQRWYEWRQHGIVLPTIVLALFGLFIVPLQIDDTFSPISMLRQSGNHILPTVPTYVAFYFPMMLVLIPLVAWIIGCGARRSDVKHTDRTLMLFFGVRPLSDGAMVAQKLWVALRASALSWGVILLACLTLATLRGGHYDAMTGSYVGDNRQPLFSVIMPYLTGQIIFVLVGGLVLMVAMTWRNYVVGYWVELSGIPWLNIAYPFSMIFLTIGAWAGASSLTRGAAEKWITIPNINMVLWGIVAIKVIVVSALLVRIYFSKALPTFTMLKGLLTYSALGSFIVCLVLAVTSPLRDAMIQNDMSSPSGAIALFTGLTIVWIPVARVLLAPLMLSRNRHRAA